MYLNINLSLCVSFFLSSCVSKFFYIIGIFKWPFFLILLTIEDLFSFPNLNFVCACGFQYFFLFSAFSVVIRAPEFCVIYINLNKSCTRKNVKTVSWMNLCETESNRDRQAGMKQIILKMKITHEMYMEGCMEYVIIIDSICLIM